MTQEYSHPVLTEIASKLGAESLDKDFHLYAQFRVQKGKRQDLEAAVAEAKALSGKEPGGLHYELLRQADADDRYVMSEHWETFADFVTHVEQPHVLKMLDDLGELLAEPPINQIMIGTGI